jgi:hypothetical protein
MTKRRRHRKNTRPDAVQEFVDWGEHQYIGGSWYHGGRLPPMSVMVVGAWTTAVLLTMAGAVMLVGTVADAIGGAYGANGSGTPDGGAASFGPYEVIAPLGMVLLGVWIMRRLRRRGRAR